MQTSSPGWWQRVALSISRAVVIAALAIVTASCAEKVVAPAPGVPKYPGFIFPVVPSELRRIPGADRIDVGWLYLQAGDHERAERIFQELATRRPELYPARAAEGYVALARQDYAGALQRFDSALASASAYAPALVGKGQALLALARDGDALAVFESAQAADATLNLRDRIDVLRLRRVQGLVEAARTKGRSGTADEARAAYEAAIDASPDSGFLYRELGVVELLQGRTSTALERLRRAVALDPMDAEAWIQIGDILVTQGDRRAAEEAYRAATDADPGADVSARLAALSETGRPAAGVPQLLAIASAEQITRGDLAALVADRLGDLLALAPVRQEVVTDTRGHWAADAIGRVVRAGVIDAFANHTFQPGARLRRADLASAAARLVALLPATTRPAAGRGAARPTIADMAPTHLDYPAASRALTAGVMALVDGRFLPTRAVSGREAGETMDRVRQLADRSGLTRR